MKALFFALMAVFFCSSSDGMAETKADLGCPPGSFYSTQFQSCLPGSAEKLPPQNPPPVQCPAGYLFNSQTQTCSKGSGSGKWDAPDSTSQRCMPGSYYDTNLKKCARNQY